VGAQNLAGTNYSGAITVIVPAAPEQPVIATLTAVRYFSGETVTVTWTSGDGDTTNYRIQWSSSQNGPWNAQSPLRPLSPKTYTTGTIARQLWWFRVGAINPAATTWSTPVSVNPAP
jgi:hypothetical protein